jgi:hypothetical protein
MIKIKFKIYEWKRATDSDVKQTRHCQWRFCIKQCKYITDSDTFTLATIHYRCINITIADQPSKTPLTVTNLQRRH